VHGYKFGQVRTYVQERHPWSATTTSRGVTPVNALQKSHIVCLNVHTFLVAGGEWLKVD
jgi:hypothetical protein